ncbi:hypothetical protein CRG98_009557 [Punica granatum]|uniref:Uncharacterized protein n=1 Tax=Punica granatum TaxID=22663 RepID=A0A2I0KNN1_PUNGR|nr:hypothetical protein CRG98_009557 [Punica granatum]
MDVYVASSSQTVPIDSAIKLLLRCSCSRVSTSPCVQLVWVQLADNGDCLNSSSTMTLMMGGCVGVRKDDAGGWGTSGLMGGGDRKDVKFDGGSSG